MKILTLSLFFSILFHIHKGYTQLAGFTAPDTVCLNAPVQLTNTSVGAGSYYWSFCTADVNAIPVGNNLGNIGGNLSLPTFLEFVQDGPNYYGFVINNTGSLVRLDYGNNLLNTPTSVSLGRLGGNIPDAEGLQVVQNEGKWYVFIVAGNPSVGVPSRLVKLELGASITNTSGTVTNYGNVGNMYRPMDIHMFKEGNNWYGFTVNSENSTITQFSFGSSFSVPPTGVNLGNIGGMNHAGGVFIINNNGNWHVFMANAGNNTLSRLDFGNSLRNTPTGVNLGNPDGALQDPRDLYLMKYCDELVGFVVNGQPNASLIRLNFSSLLSSPKATVIGNVGTLSFPHSISPFYRVGSDLYSFVTNVTNNTLTRLRISGCNNASTPNATSATPPSVSYSSPGVYNVNLTIDEGLPTQSTYCKKLVVLPKYDIFTAQDTSTCNDSIILRSRFNASTWNNNSTADTLIAKRSGTYWVNTKSNICQARDSFVVMLKPRPQFAFIEDSAICRGEKINLNIQIPGATYQWQDGNTSGSYSISAAGKYKLTVQNAEGCIGEDSVTISVLELPVVKLRSDTLICAETPIPLENVELRYTDSLKWTAHPTLSDITVPIPVATPSVTTQYKLTAYNSRCPAADSVIVSVKPKPELKVTNDTMICNHDVFPLMASGANAYKWFPADGLSDPDIPNPTTAPVTDIKYYVTGTGSNNCITLDSVQITVREAQVFSLSPLTADLCEGDSVVLTGNGADSYEWLLPDGSKNIDAPASIKAGPVTTSIYKVVARDLTCNIFDTLKSLISVKPAPKLTVARSNDIDCIIGTSKLIASGAARYEWSPAATLSNPYIYNPVARTDTTTWYHVKATGGYGCKAEDSVLVRVFTNTNINTYPLINAFTPNGDGLNDCFGIKNWGYIKTMELAIYNRWGQKIFVGTNPGDCWNGKFKKEDQPPGTYIYTIKAETLCGTVVQNGTFVLIR